VTAASDNEKSHQGIGRGVQIDRLAGFDSVSGKRVDFNETTEQTTNAPNASSLTLGLRRSSRRSSWAQELEAQRREDLRAAAVSY